MCLCIDSFEKDSYNLAYEYLYNNLINIVKLNRPIIFLCIGTDRSTGDSLGPLIGHMVNSYNLKNIYVYGTLEDPIHARNLEKTVSNIYSKFDNPYIIAIDACLGKLSDIGKIYIDKGSLYPGMALNKSLTPVGDLNITGIVNISGKFEYMILQNTRLYTVMTIANCISKIIYNFCIKTFNDSEIIKDNKMIL